MLDCETERGKTFISHQRRTQDIIESKGYKIVEMAQKDSHSDVIIAHLVNGYYKVCGVGEIKCREMAGSVPLTREYLKKGYLITYEKLVNGAKVSESLRTPFYIIVNLLSERVILIWRVTDDRGEFVFEFDTRESRTQKTCNGGVSNRLNAFLPIQYANEIQY
jgi:hypothetical protein